MVDLSLPSSLEDERLVAISVAHDGSYIDDNGEQGSLPEAVFETIGVMKVGQKVLIQEEETEEGNEENDREKEEKEKKERRRGGKI